MSQQLVAVSNKNGSENVPKPFANANSATQHQVQYCGPYKLEKTLGKGQTGKSWKSLENFPWWETVKFVRKLKYGGYGN